MSEFSRVKKNKDLYKEIIEDDKTKIIESSLRDYERRTTDPHSNESKYQASRYRKNHKLESDKEQFDQTFDLENKESQPESLSKKEILRDRDLLEEFIEEVKHYNINRGLRNVQDTQMNILQNLGKTPTENIENDLSETFKEVENITKSDQDLTREIQAIISDLDNEIEEITLPEPDGFVFTPLDEEKDKILYSIFEEIEENADKKPKTDKAVFNRDEVSKTVELEEAEESLKEEVVKKTEFETRDINNVSQEIITDEVLETTNDKRDYKSSELLELTQTLNLKLDLQEAELDNVTQKVSVLDKILSLFVLILVLALIGIILFGIFWVSKERGLF